MCKNLVESLMLFIIGIFAADGSGAPPEPPIGCAYPLDDDGTLAAAFSYEYAGPAGGEDQQTLSFTTTTGNNAILAPANIFSTARFSRPGSNAAAVEVEFLAGGSRGGGVIIISDAAGNFVNSGAIIDGVIGDVIVFRVASDGTVSASKNGSPDTIDWFDEMGQTTVGATDKYGYALMLNPVTASETGTIALRTNAATYTDGSHSAGDTDPCGEAINVPL
jgi:hypothetical protein